MRLEELTAGIEDLDVRPGAGANDAGDTVINGLSADSRGIEPGFLFAAIPGTRVDGIDYIPQAIERGAGAILTTPEGAARLEGDLPILVSPAPRRALAQLAAKYFARQPSTLCAVTGTNGKTSIASFLRQIWESGGHRAASVGTLGIVTVDGTAPLAHTTPDPVTLHKALKALAEGGITHCALEASSHGLAQYRLDGTSVDAGAFTNLSRDHLDYHDSFEDYLSAKLRLFSHVVKKGGTAVLNADADCFDAARDAASAQGLRIISVGSKGDTLILREASPSAEGIDLSIEHEGISYQLALPLVGTFQASNALIAAGLALATGSDIEQVVDALKNLQGAEGRMERVADTPRGAGIYVDYAHTPDALTNALKALRPHTRGKLHVVFGAGGDRDRGKRPEMGNAAARGADVVVVTDDNPRNEDPAAIRADVLAECPGAREVAGRRDAIGLAIAGLAEGDVLLVAGKGHEEGQTIGGVTHAFKDADVVRELIKEGVPS